MVTHLPYTRAFSIQSFIRETPKEKRFDITENNVTSTTDVESYFFDKYTYKLKIPWLPCVRVGSNKESFFPVEVPVLSSCFASTSVEKDSLLDISLPPIMLSPFPSVGLSSCPFSKDESQGDGV